MVLAHQPSPAATGFVEVDGAWAAYLPSTNGGLLEVHLGACQQAVIDFTFAAIAAVRRQEEIRAVFSIADFADAGSISSVFNRRI
jgi:hypothetical protein